MTERNSHLPDAEDLIEWASRVESRSEFPRLIRMLIRQTNDQVIRCDMRAGAGTDLGGYDGVVRSDMGTPFVPEGLSVWELGVGENPQDKAQRDYKKRTSDPLGVEKSTTTFVFATPRRWEGKEKWALSKSDWRDVVVLDADDIEARLEEAPAARSWLGEKIGKPVKGIRSIENWWDRFRAITIPELTPELVLSGRYDEAGELLRLLGQQSCRITISAPTLDDVLAFVAATLISSPEESRDEFLSRALVVSDIAALRFLEDFRGLLILVPFEEELYRQAALINSHHVVLFASAEDPALIKLPLIPVERSLKLLKSLGVSKEVAALLARSLHRGVVPYQHEAAVAGALPRSAWVTQAEDRVVRLAWLAGAWTERHSGDIDVMSELLGRPYEECLDKLVGVTRIADPVLQRAGDSWVAVLPEVSWSYMSPNLTNPDFERLESAVQTVLGATDPALDLPIEERWRAAIHGRTSPYSGELRKGLATTIAILGWVGGDLRLGSGATGQSKAEGLVSQLLARANEDVAGHLWSSLADVLPLLAEAAPDAVLRAADEGLKGDGPVVMKMFTDAQGDSFYSSNSAHTGLLWALEGLAWSGELLSAVTALLAKLAVLDPGGRSSNRPQKTLNDIFRPWLPQTTADMNGRLAVIDGLASRYPTVWWALLLSTLPENHAVGTFTHKPSYRPWSREVDEVSAQEYARHTSEVVSRLLEALLIDPDRWVSVIERLGDLPPAERSRCIEQLVSFASDGQLAVHTKRQMWEAVDTIVRRHRSFSGAAWAMPESDLLHLDDVGSLLAPDQFLDANAWLFDRQFPDLGVSRVEDIESYDEQLRQRRLKVASSVYAGDGLGGIEQLARRTKFPWQVGAALAGNSSVDDKDVIDHLDSEDLKLVEFAAGYLGSTLKVKGWDWLVETLQVFSTRSRVQARLLLESDRLEDVWSLIYSLDAEVDEFYWEEFRAGGRGPRFELFNESAKRLLERGHVSTALNILDLYSSRSDIAVDAQLVATGLEKLLETSQDELSVWPSGYELESMLGILRDSDVEEERVAMLEWRLRPALDYGSPSPLLEKKLARDPRFFTEMVSLCFRPRNRDSEEETDEDLATNAYRLLDEWAIIPGSDTPGGQIDEPDLRRWIREARELLSTADRAETGDSLIGHVLARSVVDADDNAWPAVPVRNVIEEFESSDIEEGFQIGAYNLRGVTTRGFLDGGDQERQLAEKYVTWAGTVAARWPRTAAVLRRLASGYEAEALRLDDEVERRRLEGNS